MSLTEKKILYKRNVREKWDLFNYECEEKREDVKKYGPLVKRLARGIRVNLGVGGGAYMQELMLNSRVVIGIDFSLKTLKACKRRYPSALLVAEI